MPRSVETYSRPTANQWDKVVTTPYKSEGGVAYQPEDNAITQSELESPTASTLRKAARTLEGLLRRNPNADFDAYTWLNNPEGDDDSALYARTLDGLGEGEYRPLAEDEKQVLHQMILQVRENAHQLQAHLAEKRGQSRPEAATAEPEALRDAREQREAKRGQLAELYAKRQKRLAGFDFMSDGSFGKQALAFRRKRNAYNDAVQQQLALEVMNKRFESQEEVEGFIALRTVQIANELTSDIAKKYTENDSRIGKAIHFLAGRKANGEPETSAAKKWGQRVLSYGIIPSAFIGLTVATGGSMAVVGAAGAWTGTKMYGVFESKHRYEHTKRKEGLLSPDSVHARIDSVPDVRYVNGEYEKLTTAEHIGLKIGRAAHLATSVVEKNTTSQQKKRLIRAFGSVAAGTAVAFGGHYLGTWLQGGEQHVANSTNGDTPSQSWLGEKPPVSTDIHDIPSAVNAHQNMGWYEVMQQIGIDPAQRQEILLRAAPALYKYDLAYQMADGLPGIPSTGTIPQIAIDMLKYAAGR